MQLRYRPQRGIDPLAAKIEQLVQMQAPENKNLNRKSTAQEANRCEVMGCCKVENAKDVRI